ncbi:hypothetical protein EJ06DRAFT_531842 [Trichodelitschia bisporula]|uniref:Uncharacterized protein n=1 Tax=Trichodelitschia bisporula TaxID=703511 RepID=A0A6G1HSD8_9PEZI|nr:hypothetical protein EJ06DRAFT_531842 [Trichodelitschia bisporula]
MCFYEHLRFTCGDWKWGNFREHCNREYRIGETCGMKLVYTTAEVRNKCKLCDKVDTKLRKREVELARINRWQQEGRYPASVEKSQESIKILENEIRSLYAEIAHRRQAIGNQNGSSRSYA